MDAALNFRIEVVNENDGAAPEVEVTSSDGHRFEFSEKQIGLKGVSYGLVRDGVNRLRLKLSDRNFLSTLEVRTFEKPYKTTVTLVTPLLSRAYLELPTTKLPFRIQKQKGRKLIQNEAFTIEWSQGKSVISVVPEFINIAEEVLLLAYWFWLKDRHTVCI